MKYLRPLGDAADFINGYAFKPEDWGEAGKLIIRIKNLTDASKPYNRTETKVPRKYHVSRGDLLVSWSATLGVFEWTGEDALLNQHIFKVVPKNGDYYTPYLRYAIDSSLHRMERYTHGSTMKHINRQEFLATVAWLPPIAEQRRIVAKVEQLMALVDALETQLAASRATAADVGTALDPACFKARPCS